METIITIVLILALVVPGVAFAKGGGGRAGVMRGGGGRAPISRSYKSPTPALHEQSAHEQPARSSGFWPWYLIGHGSGRNAGHQDCKNQNPPPKECQR